MAIPVSTDLLDAAGMLAYLSEHGVDAGSDFNDCDEVDGWFGWSISGDVLTIRHEVDAYAGHDGNPSVSRSWRLVPIPDGEAGDA